jgi:valyl-tRNA synthetase
MTLPPAFDPAEAEPRLQAAWSAAGIYRFDPADPRPIFAVDTPPPTVSGEIHIGHVYSYVQAEAMIRFQRMRGHNVFYPFGFDDNGLPTERYVERSRGITAREVGRAAFVQACLETSAEVEARFEQFWRRLGMGVDWGRRYSTMGPLARRTAQWSFLDLHRKGRIYRAEAPTLWCAHCGTAVAQAEVEEAQRDGRTLQLHERCDQPVETRASRQWFVRVLDAKDELLELGRRITWRPQFMRARYEHWVAGLALDWCISRQRAFGVPFPAWHCGRCGATTLADEAQLPVDPAADPPPRACPCGADDLRPDADVMDTWATSSLTPQIAAGLLADPALYGRLFPMQLRPQAHDIIRTWTFYTIVKAHFHFGALPWATVMLSGHALDPAGRKLSKSKGNAPLTPDALVARHGADAVRYWACRAALGSDQPLSEETMRQGRRLVAKLWSAGRLFEMQHAEGSMQQGGASTARAEEPRSTFSVPYAALFITDRWLLSVLHGAIAEATARWEAYDYAGALEIAERFFWGTFCDQYLELVKGRVYDGAGAERESALATLALAFEALLKLLAPVMPHVTEELFGQLFPGRGSIHTAPWPAADAALRDGRAEAAGAALVAIAGAARRHKTARGRSLGAPLAALTLACADPALRADLQAAAGDIAAVSRAAALTWVDGPDDGFEQLAPGLWLGIEA